MKMFREWYAERQREGYIETLFIGVFHENTPYDEIIQIARLKHIWFGTPYSIPYTQAQS